MPAYLELSDILAAKDRIAGTAVRTPLVKLDPARLGAAGFAVPADFPEIWLKDESKQPIGSFKLRGAYNTVAQLPADALARGVITYSSGNHAQGVAYAARALGSKAVIVMPDNAPKVKIAATEALGAEIVFVGPASSDRKVKAEELEAAHGYSMIPPYDHPSIIAGQATCGTEILEQLAELTGEAPDDATLVLSPVSGGGLLSGIATGIKLAADAAGQVPPRVVGIEPELAGDSEESFRTKTLVEWPAAKTTRTLCDGLRTQSLGVLNFEHILKFVDNIITVNEADIRSALRLYLTATDIVAEPSGAVTLAAALYRQDALPKAKRIVVVVSGGNLEPSLRATLENESAAAHV
jgi:threonine dehydratase